MNRLERFKKAQRLRNPLLMSYLQVGGDACYDTGMMEKQKDEQIIDFVSPAFCYRYAMQRIKGIYQYRQRRGLPFTMERVIDTIYNSYPGWINFLTLIDKLKEQTGHDPYKPMPSPFDGKNFVFYVNLFEALTTLVRGEKADDKLSEAIRRGVRMAMRLWKEWE